TILTFNEGRDMAINFKNKFIIELIKIHIETKSYILKKIIGILIQFLWLKKVG
ncbi:unnamed protein product, partial [marine sediment metagenome]